MWGLSRVECHQQEVIQQSLQRRTGSRRQLDTRNSVEVVEQEASSSGAPV